MGQKKPCESLTTLICCICNESLANAEAVPGHYRAQHQDKVECAICLKSFSTKYTLNTHVRTVHEKRQRLMCKSCDETFSTIEAKRDHYKAMHEGDEDENECPYCHKQFTRKYSVKSHIQNVHEKKKPFKCEECDKKFATGSQLRMHQKRHADETPYECDQCDQRFSFTAELSSHKAAEHS